MKFILAALFACGCVTLSDDADWPPAEHYLTGAKSCAESGDRAACEKMKSTWPDIYADAIARKYEAQKQVALCFSTGCAMAIRQDPILGCAWREIVIKANVDEAGRADTAARDRFCGGPLSDADRKTAAAEAQVLLRMLGVM
jgi:hypothetical protein